jgi:hypothetical protein
MKRSHRRSELDSLRMQASCSRDSCSGCSQVERTVRLAFESGISEGSVTPINLAKSGRWGPAPLTAGGARFKMRSYRRMRQKSRDGEQAGSCVAFELGASADPDRLSPSGPRSPALGNGRRFQLARCLDLPGRPYFQRRSRHPANLALGHQEAVSGRWRSFEETGN